MSEKRKKIPAEAVELYTRFIHGEISRRAFVNGVKGYAVAGLTASAIIDALMPNYALGQQVARNDERIKASYETIPSPDGYGSIRGYFVRPFSADTRDATPAKLPGGCCQSNGNSSPVRRNSPNPRLALAHDLPPLSQGG